MKDVACQTELNLTSQLAFPTLAPKFRSEGLCLYLHFMWVASLSTFLNTNVPIMVCFYTKKSLLVAMLRHFNV